MRRAARAPQPVRAKDLLSRWHGVALKLACSNCRNAYSSASPTTCPCQAFALKLTCQRETNTTRQLEKKSLIFSKLPERDSIPTGAQTSGRRTAARAPQPVDIFALMSFALKLTCQLENKSLIRSRLPECVEHRKPHNLTVSSICSQVCM